MYPVCFPKCEPVYSGEIAGFTGVKGPDNQEWDCDLLQ